MENLSIFNGENVVTMNVLPGSQKELQNPTVLQNFIMKQLDNNTLELVLCENPSPQLPDDLINHPSVVNSGTIENTMHIMNFTTVQQNEPNESFCNEVPVIMGAQNSVIQHTANSKPAVFQTSDTELKLNVETNSKVFNVSVYQCFKCSEEFNTVTLFRQHLKWHKQQKTFNCTKCSAGFNLENNLKVHQVLCHTGNINYCPICPEMKFHRQAGLKSHILVHQVEEILTCEECGGEYLSDDELVKHMESHVVIKETRRMAKSLVCPYCKLDFADNAEYKEHVDKHIEIKRKVLKGQKRRKGKKGKLKGDFVCKFCWKIFTKLSLLARHERIHTGERPHKCTVCNKAFTQSNTLQIHMFNHTGEKPFKCTLCPAKFTQKGNLRVHVRKTHTAPKGNKKMYKCAKCACIFTKVATLNAHMTKTHLDENKKDIQPESAIDKVMQSLKLLNSNLGNTVSKKSHHLSSPSSPHIPDAEVVKVTENRAEGGLRRYSIRQKKIGEMRWYFCNYCTEKFKKPSDVIRHLRTHTLEKPFQCSKCPQRFSLKSTLLYHIKVHQRDDWTAKVTREHYLNAGDTRNNRQLILNKTSKKHKTTASLKELSAPQQNSGNGVSFSTKQPLHHTENGIFPVKPPKPRIPNTGTECPLERPHHCNICNARFPRVMTLRRHMMQHADIKKFKCCYCLKAFTMKYKLTEHLKMHNNQRDFQCDTCNKKFVNSTLLKRHLVVHSDVKPYLCPYCYKYFKTITLCRWHIKQVHKNDEDIAENENNIIYITENSVENPKNSDEKVQLPSSAGIAPNEVSAENDLQMVYVDLVGNNDDFGSSTMPSIKLHDHNDSYFLKPLNELMTDTPKMDMIVDSNDTYSTKNDDNMTTVLGKDVSELSAVNLADLPISFIDAGTDENIINPDMIPCDATVFCINCHRLFSDPVAFVKHLCSGEVVLPKQNDLADNNIKPINMSNPVSEMQNCDIADTGRSVIDDLELDLDTIKSPPKKKALTNDIENDFQCKHCDFKTSLQEKYKQHLLLHQNISDRVCRFCCKEFRKPSDLKRHLRTHTGEKPFECETCHKKFSLKSTLLSHKNTHDFVSPSNISCDVCNSVFTTKSSLKVHMLLHTGARPHSCQFCEQTFRTSATRRTHEANVHLKPQTATKAENVVKVIAEQVGKTERKLKLSAEEKISAESIVPTMPERAILFNPDGTTMALDQVLFFSQESTSDIILTSENGEPISLGDLTVLGLDNIEIADTGQVAETESPEPTTQKQKKVECDICHKMYSSKDVLRKHKKRLHGQNKKFPCIKCDKGYDQLEELNKHIAKLHTGSRPYECPYCKNSFGEESSLKTHIKRIHSESRLELEAIRGTQDMEVEGCYLITN